MQTKTLAIIGTALAFIAQSALGQNPSASQVVDASQQRRQFQPAGSPGETNAPELYAGETSDVGPQSVLKMKMPRWHLEGLADEQIYYTDNMFLDENLRQSADVLVSTIQVALDAPQMHVFGGELTPRLGIQEQWFTYGLLDNAHVQAITLGQKNLTIPFQASLDTFDFNAQTFFGDFIWTRNNWVVTAGFQMQRLVDSFDYNEFYREYTPTWSIQKTVNICPRCSVTVGYQGDYRFSITLDPPAGYGTEMNDRTDQSAFGALNFIICPHAILQPFDQFQFTHYTNQDREDYLNTCGLALYLPISKNFSMRAFYSFAEMSTDGALAQDYRNMEGGLGASLSVQF